MKNQPPWCIKCGRQEGRHDPYCPTTEAVKPKYFEEAPLTVIAGFCTCGSTDVAGKANEFLACLINPVVFAGSIDAMLKRHLPPGLLDFHDPCPGCGKLNTETILIKAMPDVDWG